MTRMGMESGDTVMTLPPAVAPEQQRPLRWALMAPPVAAAATNLVSSVTPVVLTLMALLALVTWPLPGRAQLPGEEEAPPPPTNCAVSGFRAAVTDAPEGERNAKALEWLAQEGPKCTLDRWILIRNNRNQWMGTADSAKLAGVIDTKVEELAREDAAVINNLFTSPPPPAPKKE